MTKLETVADVTAAIRALTDLRHARNGAGAQVKPAQRRIEAGRFADLFEIRARMWRELGEAAIHSDAIPDAYASACVVAEVKDSNDAKYWRERAGSRDG